ncbi:MAG: hypothetical protein QOF56_453 [Acidobacteriaceae bacterium]|nr:hypothetical protein [Acidobacteriaceae bacterium]
MFFGSTADVRSWPRKAAIHTQQDLVTAKEWVEDRPVYNWLRNSKKLSSFELVIRRDQ